MSKTLTQEEAIREAKRRWGPNGDAWIADDTEFYGIEFPIAVRTQKYWVGTRRKVKYRYLWIFERERYETDVKAAEKGSFEAAFMRADERATLAESQQKRLAEYANKIRARLT